ncbi:Non-histone chromosomal protein 6 [Neolecta irregularis DAH-3]|uniref:Non-histone chromosomal protein 6 n=1 Tax=Neolecta irregularis (strain DAH-3) TaxID=1198029 RepID=A0A1U7LHM3_NEOID|nr:Non-histone chromosomal protein 6 [Neolecta irregularis DAH-3]|eukprot:OLL22128.1 Non-histone chromosomal protein 6 [Neolecta irregularis DAH-3]
MPKAATKPRATRKAAPTTKSKKDPNHPKRALSAYMFFANEERPKVIQESPETSFGMCNFLFLQCPTLPHTRLPIDSHAAHILFPPASLRVSCPLLTVPGQIGKILGPFDKKAAEDKKRYETQKAAYIAKPASAGEEEEEDEE